MPETIYSMTGFGRCELKQQSRKLIVEVRTVNNRYLDVSVRTPRWLYLYENMIRETVKKNIERGKVDVVVICPGGDSSISDLKLDRHRAEQYAGLLGSLKSKLKLSGGITVSDLLQFDDVFQKEDNDTVRDEYGQDLQTALVKALNALQASRLREGRVMAKDLKQRVAGIRKNLKQIIGIAKKRGPQLHKQMRTRLAGLLNGEERINPDRLEMEVALLSDRMDINEECVRLVSHLDLFLETMKEGGALGKKLDFVLQEMNREVNTIGSKGNSFDIAGLVVNMKEDVERLREQVRNLV
jgi:uncharacterized protein (TIGR00255 family)